MEAAITLTPEQIDAIAEAVAQKINRRELGDYIGRKDACKIIGCGITVFKALCKQYPDIKRKGKRGVYVRKYCDTLAKIRRNGNLTKARVNNEK